MSGGFVHNRNDARSYQKTAPNTIFSLPYTATASLPAAASTNEGCIVYDSTANAVKFSDGSSWTALITAASAGTADAVYNAGAWTVTGDANDVVYNFVAAYNMKLSASATGSACVLETDNATGTATTSILCSATATVTTAIDASAANIVNALSIGANAITGTYFGVSAAGAVTAVGVDYGSGSLVGTGDIAINTNKFNVTGSSGDVSVNNGKFTITGSSGAVVSGNITGLASQTLAIAAGATGQAVTVDGNGAGTVGIGTTSTGNVSIGNGSVTQVGLTATTVAVTGDFTVSGTATIGSFNISAVQPSSGNLTLNGATGATTITIGNLSTGGIIVSDNMSIGAPVAMGTTNDISFYSSNNKIYASVDNQIDIDATTEVEIGTATLDVNASTAVNIDTAAYSIDSTSASNVSVTGANLAIQTLTSGILDLDAAGNFTLDAGGTLSLDGVGNSNITVDSGNIEVNCTTSGVITIDGFSEVDIEIANADEIKYTTGSMQFQQATNISTTTGALTLTPTTDVLIANGTGITVGHTAQLSQGGGATARTPEAQVLGTALNDASLAIGIASATAAEGATLILARSKAAALGTHTVVADDDAIGYIDWAAADGTDTNTVIARIKCEVDDATPATSDIGGAVVFMTATGGGSADNVAESFRINAARNLCIANANALLVGSETQCTVNGTAAEAQVLGTASADGSLVLGTFVGAAADNPPRLLFVKSRNGTIGSSTVHVDDDQLGEIVWVVADGSDLNSPCAAIKCNVDEGAVGANKSGGDMVFYTTAEGGETLTAVMTLDSTQDITFASGTHIGLKATAPSATAVIYGDFTTTTTGGFDAINIVNSVADTTGANANQIRGAYLAAEIDSTNNQDWTHATVGLVGVEGATLVENGATGTITGVASFYATAASIEDVTITSRYGLYVATSAGDATVTTGYGVYIADQTDGTSDYGLYIAGADTAAIKVAADASIFMGGVYGSDAADGNLTLGSTTNATEGCIIVPDETEGFNIGGTQGWNGKDNYIFMKDAGNAPAGAPAVQGGGLYASGGEVYAIDNGGAATKISPHDDEGYYVYYSVNTGQDKGINKKDRVLVLHIERALRKLAEKFPEDFAEFIEESVAKKN